MPKLLRMTAAFLLVAALLPVSACGDEAVPKETGAFEPIPAVEAGEFTVMYLVPQNGYDYTANEDCAAYLQKLLNERGWGIRFSYYKFARDEQTGEPTDVQVVEEMAASGAAPDAWALTAADAERLMNAGYVLDLSSILPEAAPVLYNMYRPIFSEKVAGLPMNLTHRPKGGPTAFVLQKELAEKAGGISTMSDVLDFLDANEGYRIMEGVSLSPNIVMDAWAGEQGYYSLHDYGIREFLYAAYNDPLCTPVPIENIPGFDGFFKRVWQAYRDKRILTHMDYYMAGGDHNVVGCVGMHLSEVDAYFLNAQRKTGADYIAYPLKGCGKPVLPDDSPQYHYLMAVSSSSGKAALAAKFSQWVLTDQENFNLVNYGVEGVDYRMEGDRIAYLDQGKETSTYKIYASDASTAFRIRKPILFYTDTMALTSVDAPSNYREAMAAADCPTPPMWDIEAMRELYIYSRSSFSDIHDRFEELEYERSELLWLFNVHNTGAKDAGERLLELSLMARETELMAAAYAERIRELREKQGRIE